MARYRSSRFRFGQTNKAYQLIVHVPEEFLFIKHSKDSIKIRSFPLAHKFCHAAKVVGYKCSNDVYIFKDSVTVRSRDSLEYDEHVYQGYPFNMQHSQVSQDEFREEKRASKGTRDVTEK